MGKKKCSSLSVLLVLFFSIFVSGCNNNKTILLNLRHDLVEQFINATDEHVICEILAEEPTIFDEQASFVVAHKDDCYSFRIEFSETETFEKSFAFVYENSRIPTCGLIPGRDYYYRISDNEEPDRYFQKGHIKTKGDPGTFYTVEGMNNVRDLGGWTGENGKTIKFDKIIRGGRTNKTNNEPAYSDLGHEILANSLGIRGEIDLRHSSDNFGQTRNFIDKTFPFLNSSYFGYSEILPDFAQTEPVARQYRPASATSCKNIFSFLAKEENYPVYIHCNAGADRTGTICMLIEGMLGVSVEDIYKEFELTSFSPYERRWRSSIDYSTYTFEESGVMQDDNQNYVGMGKCVETLWATYAPNGSFQDAVTNYLKTVCQISDDTINSIKNIMLQS